MRDYSSFLTYLFVAIGVLLASVGVLYQYSYWWDELYSVTAASLNTKEMFEIFILNDVHPPLYTILLNYWIDFFGSSERATRFLSFMFTLFSLLVIWMWSKKELDKIGFQTTVIFFSTCSLFAVYAQEVRSYAMMLFLSSLLTALYFKNWHNKSGIKLLIYFSVAISLSLTHYFGFIYSGLILIFSLYDVRYEIKKASYVVFSGLICFLWPIFHFLNGNIGSKTKDNFWIKSDGLQSTISNVSNGLTPQINIVLSSAYFVAIAFSIFLIFVFWLMKKSVDNLVKTDKKIIATKLGLLFLLFVVVIALIDSHSPISTRRNYIVLLPVFSIILGLAAEGLKSIGVKYAFVIVILGALGNLGATAIAVKSKSAPAQNNSGAAKYIENEAGSKDNIYYLARDGSSMMEAQKMMAEFYFSDIAIITPVYRDEFKKIERPFYLLMQHQNDDVEEIIAVFKSLDFEVDYFLPQKNNSVVVIYGE